MTDSTLIRANGRDADELRPVTLTPGVMKNAAGSCLAEFGDTRVLCTASVEEGVPGWRKNARAGWVTAEYAMLPAAGNRRTPREYRGRKGRSMEIERLIGRSLRSVTRLDRLGEITITLDCDVIQADGGTRTASITGAWVALHQALMGLVDAGRLPRLPLTGQVAAVSAGFVDARTPMPRWTSTSWGRATAASWRSRAPASAPRSTAPSSTPCSTSARPASPA